MCQLDQRLKKSSQEDILKENLVLWKKMASASEMSLSDTANVIPWFATGRGGAHIGKTF